MEWPFRKPNEAIVISDGIVFDKKKKKKKEKSDIYIYSDQIICLI
jgi:hypothetical protein